MALYIDEDTIDSINIVDNLDQEVLDDLGEKLVTLVEEDDASRTKWLNDNAEWLKLTSQVIETKNTPWENAANVKYPLLTTACINFHARAYGALFQEPNLLNSRVYGEDPFGQKASRAYRTAQYGNFYLIEKMGDWLAGMDRGLFILAITGMVYKKTYFSTVRNRIASDLISAKDVIINYQARNFETARKTHRIWLTENQVEEYKRKGIFRKVELGTPEYKTQDEVQDKILGVSPTGSLSQEFDAPREIFEIHWVWDLDGDGYKEPWIFTVDRDSKTVLRIVPRFEFKNIEFTDDDEKEIAAITPEEQFTLYIFIPDPNSPLYGMGLGSLVGPLNLAINTNINQLIDSGTLSNMSTGFLGKGLNLRGGKYKTKPGFWQSVNNLGDDLRKEIVQIPANDPSPTLYNLLVLLIQSGERLASINDALMGENPGQNQPYATTAAVLEQGLKVFVGIYKRIFKSLTEEYKKIFNLLFKHMDEQEYFLVLDSQESGQISKEDFNPADCDIRPVGDPKLVTDAQKLMRSQLLMEKLMNGMIPNKQEAVKRILEAEGHPDVNKLFEAPPPEPSLEEKEFMLEVEKFKHQQKLDVFEKTLDEIRIQFEAMKDKAQAMAFAVKAETAVSEQDAKIVSEINKQIIEDEKNATAKLKVLADLIKQTRDAQLEEKRFEHEKEMSNKELQIAKQNKTNNGSKQSSSSNNK